MTYLTNMNQSKQKKPLRPENTLLSLKYVLISSRTEEIYRDLMSIILLCGEYSVKYKESQSEIMERVCLFKNKLQE